MWFAKAAACWTIKVCLSQFVVFQQHKNTKTTSKHYCHYARDSIAIHNTIRCSVRKARAKNLEIFHILEQFWPLQNPMKTTQYILKQHSKNIWVVFDAIALPGNDL